MTATTDLGVDGRDLLGVRRRASRLPYRLSQRNEIIDAVRGGIELAVVADQFPAAGRG
jgi:hypothetical protein